MNSVIYVASVVPTILTDQPAEYAARLKRVQPFVTRIHIDITDGRFAPSQTIGLSRVYGFEGAEIDLHLMMHHPEKQIETIISLNPALVIWHLEAEADHHQMLQELGRVAIKRGMAILPPTDPTALRPYLADLDHVLVFTGHLGFNGGEMQTDCLPKIKQVKALKAGIEVGVDGGVNFETAKLAVAAGADVLNSGGFIQTASSPKRTYEKLAKIAGGVKL